MEKIVWRDSLNIGSYNIDKQHKILINIINRLIDSKNSNEDRRVINEVLSELLEYSIIHFRDEELLLENVNFPNLEQHKNKHYSFKLNLAKSCEDVMTGKADVNKKLIDFLSDWFTHHISQEDQSFKNYI